MVRCIRTRGKRQDVLRLMARCIYDSWQNVVGLMVLCIELMVLCIKSHGIMYLEVWDYVLDARYYVLEFLAE